MAGYPDSLASAVETRLYGFGQGVLTGSVPSKQNLTAMAKSAYARASDAIKGQAVGYIKGQVGAVIQGNDVSSLASGNIGGAPSIGLDSGYFDGIGVGSGPFSNGANVASWISAGKSLQDLQKETSDFLQTHYARKNIWYIEIEDENPPPFTLGYAGLINQFAVDLNYTPWTFQGGGLQVGSLHVDELTSSDRTDIRLTTFDDARGYLQKWFYGKCGQVSNGDGTFGLPRDYLLRLRVRKMAVTREGWVHSSTKGIKGGKDSSWDDAFLVRPTSIEIDLSRRDQALQELQMTFTQWDTNMQPK